MTTRRRTAAALVAVGAAALALTVATAPPVAAHGSMTDPVSRVAACHAEGPESPTSAACKALVAAGGTQPLYDWNEVNIGDAAGRHRQIIPDGKLCSAGREKYKGLDLPRADWPATPMSAGDRTFRYRATAPHKGTFELYITKEGYDPAKPLAWADLEPEPFAKATDPTLEDGSYVFSGTVPERSGRHLVYAVWQRSDSPEAFYGCSDVVFGGAGGDGGAAPAAPTEEQISESAEKSTVSHDGHGGDEPGEKEAAARSVHTGAEDGAPAGAERAGQDDERAERREAAAPGDAPVDGATPNGAARAAEEGVALADTGGDDATTAVALGGAAAVVLGGAVVLTTARRRAAGGRHRA
ncbi:lytic polysaccharide monooxygenase auxiliary activity family 9 protein [Streptomyces megasporus]|uniref:lytic polysaccharide monooxygenase auxiliary activity family 9 protein n=1 Tax=Streptomyces megasporus TaxID=44060 RepID=UPI0004E2535E|nr:lytic polysaccharide monooxygenase [Streptomyces megasporus]